jgi:hypothetical protein
MDSLHPRVVDLCVIISCPYIHINVFIHNNCFMHSRLHESGLLSHVKWMERAICKASHVITMYGKMCVINCRATGIYHIFPASINVWVAASFASLISHNIYLLWSCMLILKRVLCSLVIHADKDLRCTVNLNNIRMWISN